MESVDSPDEKKTIVFYTYDEEMMKHRDENRHDAYGKNIVITEEANVDFRSPDYLSLELISPEVPFRIKAIYDYLRTTPVNAPLLS